MLSQEGGDMREQLKIGDVVTLRSGGPRMTVISIGRDVDRIVHTSWIDSSDCKVVCKAAFPAEALDLVKS
jgi:uncharacterized protein YodC (DUF2158 family)